MAIVSATGRGDLGQPEGPPEVRWDGGQEGGTPGGPAPKGLAGRRYQTWASRYEKGQGAERSEPISRGTGWEILSYLIAGMLAYGGIGWLIARAVHVQILFPVGMLTGLVISLGWVICKYGRQR